MSSSRVRFSWDILFLGNSRKQSFIRNLGKHYSISFCKLPFTNSTEFDINTWCQPKHWSLAEKRESLHKELSLHTSRRFLARLLVMTKLELKVIGNNYAVHSDSLEMLFQKFKVDLNLFNDVIQLIDQMWPKQDDIFLNFRPIKLLH